MIEIEDLNIRYGNFIAIDNLNLNVEKYSSCAIIGPSGCGKTTLLYAVAGILKPSSGLIKINGEKIKGNRKSTGIILQNYGLLPWKTVWDNVALGLKIRKANRETINKKVTNILKKLDLEDLKDKYPVQLSGGQRQRVAIARTLTIEPDLLLMDEPFSSLDAISRESLQDLLLRLYKENKMTMVIVTHNIEEAVFLGHKIVIMAKREGKIKKVIENPYFGDEEFRNRVDFYKICREVRNLMEKDET
ncbi:ABC transporter ATP-binding protein [Thermohalobacter berrensis]|uniref:Nitrate ABC transporter ATP-binding protein n=1 Tax=Thermohalobacter berrensis TaxID=99594 RepID=A0A419T1D9_9FIRM|nr:ABC transporter ATP-binding protein [Thermohalobacter berrensis]RKD31231.1 nitrate ABC transporter ATP-binding protein [Thermohalobacter berrensis]